MKRADKLAKLVGDYVLSKGGGLTESRYGYKWKLPTKHLGEMLVDVHDSDHCSIFGRFQGDDVSKAHEGVGCNPFSGKWNFHFNKDLEPEATFEEWKRNVEPLL